MASAAAIQVIQSPPAAEALLHPARRRILLEMQHEPDSASGLARKLDLPRQQVNYHLRELEKHKLVEFVEERRKGNCLERVMRAAARSYVISPAALGRLGMAADEARDQFSSSYLLAAAVRTIRDVAAVRAAAHEKGKRIATLTLESEITFRNAAERGAFAEELLQTVAALISKHHAGDQPGVRKFKILVGAYPALSPVATPSPAAEPGSTEPDPVLFP